MQKKIKVLLVEDNEDDAFFLKRKLQDSPNAGYVITTAKTMKECLACIDAEIPDLIVSDLGLPDSQGLDTVKHILQKAPHTPLVVLSGTYDESVAIKAVQAGAQDYLVKGQTEYPRMERSLHYSIERARLQTELEKRHREILRYQSNLHKVLDKSADAIFVVGADKEIIFANPAAFSLMAYKQSGLIKERFEYDLAPGQTIEIKMAPPDKKIKTGELTTVEMEWEGEPAYLVTIHDITQLKEAETQLRELDKMKMEFLSNISHELRTPLQSISGFTELIMKGAVPEKDTQQEFLQIIHQETLRLGSLINSLLDMSRLESGNFKVNRKPVNICETITGALKMLESLARQKSIRLVQAIPEDLPAMEADEERMRQVIINLVGNAIKFSNAETTITVTAETAEDMFFFHVSDQGTGITEENMKHLFERFYREEGKAVRGGTGLGLFISRQIIEAHGGKIWAESRAGKGSTFSFSVPLMANGGKTNG